MTPSADALFAAWTKMSAASAFFLLFTGGMVASGGIDFEHGHRLIAGCVALMTLVLALLSRRPGVSASARKAALLASGGVLIQAFLGGMTALTRLPFPVAILHACLGQAVFCLLLAAAVLASPFHARLPADQGGSKAVRLATLGFAAAYLQLALGALLRHTGLGLAWHLLWAASVALLAAGSIHLAWREGPPALRRPASLLAVAIPLQLCLGLLVLRVRVDSTFLLGFREAAVWRTAHLSGGALTLASFLLLALTARRTAETA